MEHQSQTPYTAFAGHIRISSGSLAEVAIAAKKVIDNGNTNPILIFDNQAGRVIDVDFRGSEEEVAARIPYLQQYLKPDTQPEGDSRKTASGPGRPKLGVIAREITLLPRHWEWLKTQRGGASVTLRKLVDQARRDSEPENIIRELQTSVYQFMTAIGGDLPGFEEALRALYAGDRHRFLEEVDAWPADIRDHLVQLSSKVFASRKHPQ